MKRTKIIAAHLFVCLSAAIVLTGCGSDNTDPNTDLSETTIAAAEATEAGGIDYMVLVNKTHKLPDDWESQVVLKEATNIYGDTFMVEEKALEQFLKLREALLEEGVDIELDSVTRSVAEQQQLWDDWTVEYGEDYVKKYVAVPGFSEHHTGLAIDVCLEKDGKRIDDNDDMIAERETFAVIHAKLADYGFILRYLEGKDDITGYSYEPWHFRYIDDPEVAKEIMDQGITFEEYLDNWITTAVPLTSIGFSVWEAHF